MACSMKPSKHPRLRKFCLFFPLGLITLCLLAVAASALSNLGLPQHSKTVDHLSELEKARLSEVLHLRRALGEAVWPGWGQADIPLIVYNEQYAFLLGYADPPAGWLKVPDQEPRGGSWEQVPGEAFEGSPYYRTLLTDPQKTPQGFTVRVGERWAATFQTREYGEITFYRDIRKAFPPFISTFVPVRLAWALLMGKTDAYIAALEHESFHAYEGIQATDQLAQAEYAHTEGETYPFGRMDGPWKQEMNALLQAARAADLSEAKSLARQFLSMRAARRTGLSADQVEYEQLMEWEEGLAKYAELEISRQAESTADYRPVVGMAQDSGFKNYKGQQRFWSSQLNEALNTGGRSGETRFYYSGNALAVALDRLMPGWKPRALPGGEYLDVLLQEAVK